MHSADAVAVEAGAEAGVVEDVVEGEGAGVVEGVENAEAAAGRSAFPGTSIRNISRALPRRSPSGGPESGRAASCPAGLAKRLESRTTFAARASGSQEVRFPG